MVYSNMVVLQEYFIPLKFVSCYHGPELRIWIWWNLWNIGLSQESTEVDQTQEPPEQLEQLDDKYVRPPSHDTQQVEWRTE